ncbi:MAG: hypothetical protein ACLP9L_37020 [Thermoguttaceae bacterium]
MKMFLRWISVTCLMLMTGCGLDGPIPRKPQPDEAAPASQPPESKPGEAEQAPAEKVATQEASSEKLTVQQTRPSRSRPRRGAQDAGTEKSTAEQKPGTVREKAKVGMGEKGRGYGGGIITEPIHVMFTAQETIVLQRIDEATKFYRAEHDGQPPKTQDEFMDRIIKANSIRLPTLPQGARYVYNPSTGELMVERPSNDP